MTDDGTSAFGLRPILGCRSHHLAASDHRNRNRYAGVSPAHGKTSSAVDFRAVGIDG